MARYITESKDRFREDVENVVHEGFDLGLDAQEIDKMVQEAIAWVTVEFFKEGVFE